MPKKIKILFISSEFPPAPGGIGNQGYNIVKQLNKNGFSTDVLTKADYAPDEEIADFIEKAGFKIFIFKRHKIALLTFLYRIYLTAQVLRRYEYDIIICSGQFSLWVGYLIKLFCKRFKTIAITHGGEINSPNRISRKVTDQSIYSFDAIVSVSHYTKRKLPTAIIKDKERILRVIPNGINPSEFNITNTTKANKFNYFPNLLTVGAIWERKGQQNVVKALPVIKEKFPRVHYHCVGYKLQEKRLVDIAEELNVTKDITLYGNVDRLLLESFYKNADIFLMLSANTKSGDFEGFGIAVLEANLFGKPAIGSKYSGISDAIIDGKTGYLVDPNSPEEICNAIAKTIENYAYLSENAKDFALKHSWENIAKRYFNLIEEVL